MNDFESDLLSVYCIHVIYKKTCEEMQINHAKITKSNIYLTLHLSYWDKKQSHG